MCELGIGASVPRPLGRMAQDSPCSDERGSRLPQSLAQTQSHNGLAPRPRIEVRFLGNAICPDARLYLKEQGGQSVGPGRGRRRATSPVP